MFRPFSEQRLWVLPIYSTLILWPFVLTFNQFRLFQTPSSSALHDTAPIGRVGHCRSGLWYDVLEHECGEGGSRTFSEIRIGSQKARHGTLDTIRVTWLFLASPARSVGRLLKENCLVKFWNFEILQLYNVPLEHLFFFWKACIFPFPSRALYLRLILASEVLVGEVSWSFASTTCMMLGFFLYE